MKFPDKNTIKVTVGLLAASAAFFTGLIAHESYRSKPYLDSGKVATIGIGTTQYPDGRRVTMQDKPVSKEQAIEYARAHVSKDEVVFKKSLQGVNLSQDEYDLYLDFMYQYGQGAWNKSSIRRELLAGNHRAACERLLRYRFVGKTDCKARNSGCYGVWTRQKARYDKCVAANTENILVATDLTHLVASDAVVDVVAASAASEVMR